MAVERQIREAVVIKFAGDSGDGMQLTGSQFTGNTVRVGNDVATFPDFPAEIRAPQGTLAGVSGFQIHFGSLEINTPGDQCDVLVAMNAAALKANLRNLKPGSMIIANTDGFDSKNLRLANYAEEDNPLQSGVLDAYEVHELDITKLTRESLADTDLDGKAKDRSKNMFVLGFLYWLYNREPQSTIDFLEAKFSKKPDILDGNVKALKAGYHFGETTEAFSSRFEVKPADLPAGTYRGIIGNQATALGLIAASKKSGLDLFYGSYPITPASDILHELSKHKNYGVKTFQAEDEIAAVCSAIGAAFGGGLGVTGTSGPGMALKAESIGLVAMLELPLVVLNVQRAGPSTGMPTKTEQADLLQAIFGRNGECPVPVVAASSPADCFETAMEACRIAIEHMTPVIFLSDGYIANGSEPWRFPKADDLPEIKPNFASANGEEYLPYKRNEQLVRSWAVPGAEGLEHRLGGLEKEADTGNVSYDPDNHHQMVLTRAAKVQAVADNTPAQEIDNGPEQGELLMLGWGSTYGSIRSAVKELQEEGHQVAHAHLRYIHPFPKNLGKVLASYKKVLVPEMNNGQLVKLIRTEFLIDAIPYNKIQGLPMTKQELVDAAKKVLKN